MWTQSLRDGYRRCLWATRVLHQLQTRNMATPDSLSSLQAQLTLKWKGKDPEIVTVLEPETICWKNQLSEVMSDSQKPQPSWKSVLSPNVNEEWTHTQINEQTQQKWARRYREQRSGHHGEEVVHRRKGTRGHLYGDRRKLNWVHRSEYWNQIIILYIGNNL